nr:unnamed protein product [Callosobruchus analis]
MSISGTALGSWALQLKPLDTARSLAQNVGCDFTDTKEMVDCLRTRPASLLAMKTKQCLHPFQPFPCCPFAPVVEKGGKKPFLDDHPYKLLKQGKVLDVPWITSLTADDGLVISSMTIHRMEETNEKWNDVAGSSIVHYFRSAPHILEKIKRHYAALDHDAASLSFEELTKLSTDRTFVVPLHTAVELQSRATKSPVYVYHFNYEGVNSVKTLLAPDQQIKGVCHGDDMIYFMGAVVLKPLSDQDVKMKDVCMDILYSYATKGVPSINQSGWESVKKDFVYYDINGPNDIQKRIERDFHAKKFWDNLGLIENENLAMSKDEL